VLDDQGNLLAEYAYPNDGSVGPFSQPHGVIVDKNARIIVADTGNNRVASVLGALPALPLVDVSIAGPTTGFFQTAYTFISTGNPITATWPITYTWKATGQSDVIHTDGISDTVSFSWNTAGIKTITLTAANPGGTVFNTHVITITQGYKIYLPLIRRSYP